MFDYITSPAILIISTNPNPTKIIEHIENEGFDHILIHVAPREIISKHFSETPPSNPFDEDISNPFIVSHSDDISTDNVVNTLNVGGIIKDDINSNAEYNNKRILNIHDYDAINNIISNEVSKFFGIIWNLLDPNIFSSCVIEYTSETKNGILYEISNLLSLFYTNFPHLLIGPMSTLIYHFTRNNNDIVLNVFVSDENIEDDMRKIVQNENIFTNLYKIVNIQSVPAIACYDRVVSSASDELSCRLSLNMFITVLKTVG